MLKTNRKSLKRKLKGDIEFIQGYLLIIVAIAIGMLMIFFLLKYYPSDEKTQIRSNIAKELAKHALECWKENRYGMNPTARVCNILNITNITTEFEITKFLDCELLPNNICLFDNCENCSSKAFEDDDKLEVFLESAGEIKIAYSDRRIIISSLICDKSCVCKRNCKEVARNKVRECINFGNNMNNCLTEGKNNYETCLNKCW